MRRNQKLVVGLTLAAGLTLAGCQKPPPEVTFFSGSSSERLAPICWTYVSDDMDPKQCAQEIVEGRSAPATSTLEVVPGSTLGVSVDEAVAEAGWTLKANGNPLVEKPLTTTYYRFTLPNSLPDQGFELRVTAGQNLQTKGIWSIKVAPQPR